MRGTNKTNEAEMKNILKEIKGDFKKKPIQNAIGWFIVVPIGIPFVIANYLLLSFIWTLNKLRLAICYPMAMIINYVASINK